MRVGKPHPYDNVYGMDYRNIYLNFTWSKETDFFRHPLPTPCGYMFIRPFRCNGAGGACHIYVVISIWLDVRFGATPSHQRRDMSIEIGSDIPALQRSAMSIESAFAETTSCRGEVHSPIGVNLGDQSVFLMLQSRQMPNAHLALIW